MANILSTLRNSLKSKVNQVSSDSNLVWMDTDFDEAIAAGVRHVLLFGGMQLVEGSVLHRTNDSDGDHLTNKGSGYADKPSDYLRYENAEVDGKWVEKYIPASMASEYNKISGNQFLEADSDKKYLIDISGTEFLIYPTTWSSTMLIYIKELPPFASDNDVTTLNYSGDDYALDWAFALLLESKNYRPELADRIFNRVDKMIREAERTKAPAKTIYEQKTDTRGPGVPGGPRPF